MAFLLANPAYPIDTQDSQIFIAGFNAYQKKDYKTAVDKISQVLQKYPDTPLRDMAIFWLARSHYKAGNLKEAARYMAQFFKEYPDNPLKGTVEEELASLAGKYQRGEQIVDQVAERRAAEERAVQAKAEAERLAQEQAAKEKAEQERLAAEKAAAERLAAEQAARVKAEEERLAQEKAAAQRLAAEKAAAEKAEAERLAQEKAAAEKAALEKAAAQRLAAEQAARVKAEEERLAQEKAAAQRLAAEKAAAEKAEAERLSREKAEAERLALEKAAREKAQAEGQAEAKITAPPAVAVKSDQERLAEEQAAAEQGRLGKEKIAESLKRSFEKTRQRAEMEKQFAAEQAAAEGERQAAEKLAAETRAAAKPAAEPVEKEKAVLAAEAGEKVPVVEVPAKPLPPKKVPAKGRKVPAREKAADAGPRERSAAMREKAVAEYKALIDRYPGSQAAANAAARLKGMGIVYPPVAAAPAAPAGAAATETARVLTLEVGQYAGLDFSLPAGPQVAEAGKGFTLPFEVTNRGNAADSFLLEAGFPPDYHARFAAAAAADVLLSKTPALAPGEKFKGLLLFDMPAGVIDGERKLFPLKAISESDGIVTQSRGVQLIAAAPLLRAVIKADKVQVLPGEKVQYGLSLLNIGTATARQVTLRLAYPPQYRPIASDGLKSGGNGTLLLEGLQFNSGESRELTVTVQLKEDALAQQELFLRAELINDALQRHDSFISTAAFVQGISGIETATHLEKVVVIPGQSVTIPLTVTNTGNVREEFTLKPAIPDKLAYAFYQDLNRDGIRQASEPVINHVGPLAPREVANVLLEIASSASEPDGTVVPLAIGFASEIDKGKSSVVKVRLVYSRPVLELSLAGKAGKLKPGEVSTLELDCINKGSSLAKVVEVQSIFPAQLELVASDPAFRQGAEGAYVWKFEELGSGEKRSIRVTYRVRPGTAVGMNIALKNVLKYQDQLGNSY